MVCWAAAAAAAVSVVGSLLMGVVEMGAFWAAIMLRPFFGNSCGGAAHIWTLPDGDFRAVLCRFIVISAAIGLARTFGNRKSGCPIPVPAWDGTADHANFGALYGICLNVSAGPEKQTEQCGRGK